MDAGQVKQQKHKSDPDKRKFKKEKQFSVTAMDKTKRKHKKLSHAHMDYDESSEDSSVDHSSEEAESSDDETPEDPEYVSMIICS